MGSSRMRSSRMRNNRLRNNRMKGSRICRKRRMNTAEGDTYIKQRRKKEQLKVRDVVRSTVQ
jgi:hypothetical protein